MNLSGSEIISTYVYKVGLKSFQYSYSTAINLFQTVINLVILVTVNFISRRLTKNWIILRGELMKITHKSRRPKSLQEKIFDVLVYGMAILLILLIIYPLWFVIIASFSNPQDVATGAVWFWPKSWSLEGYKTLFAQPLIWRSYFNTRIAS
ncbi:putative multiple-sugar transport system permease YteP [Lactococcus lactis]|nr:putative multiple-sugar transport system permease YteP [Lactococcus lactis]